MVRGYVHGGRQIELSKSEVVRAGGAISGSVFLFLFHYLRAVPKAEELILPGMKAELAMPAAGIGPPESCTLLSK